MSGHSKWNNIKRKKEGTDAKRAKIFTKIGREIALAVKNGGANPVSNTKLRDIIAKAKANNVPNDNINRMLAKAEGAGAEDYVAMNYEGYGPAGIAVIVETLTDNKNRTAADVRHAFDKYGRGMGANGCVSWQFKEQGVLIVDRAEGLNEGPVDEDELMMQAVDAGAEDFVAEDDVFDIYTAPDDFSAVLEALEGLGYSFISAEVAMVPQNTVHLDSEEDVQKMEKMIELLEDNDDVQNIWHNWEE
ncbi:MAG: YebC/PmpR family DNA-binding transcriptional regulator [Eubacteriales bacterium]|nr:YebC/PmpR family DNA-binding transcriptional regulator [Clostridiales bacterium]MDY3071445.1 YebC/PmpR family DNA-binding transcriptional regulator [Eubacteriales bacterium]MDY3286753.1 YebC/PmpR family DNA-binding transcriptional regulator [Eubacteriales bacterium]MDY5016409.1 YebC/PmpR family DNA-binding transcriptional regulator [Eubacteriales bacterium]